MYANTIVLVTNSDKNKDENFENIEDNADGKFGYKVYLTSYIFWLRPLAFGQTEIFLALLIILA